MTEKFVVELVNSLYVCVWGLRLNKTNWRTNGWLIT